MNIDIINLGRYRITSHGGRAFDMYNRDNDRVYNLTKLQFDAIKDQMSIAACEFVEKDIGRYV